MRIAGTAPVRQLALAIMLASAGVDVMAGDAPAPSFEPDPKIGEIAAELAADAVGFAKDQFGTSLDWSDRSIAEVEKGLQAMHASYAKAEPRPTQKEVTAFARMFGSYVGEVYRRNHGAEWGIVTWGDAKEAGLRTKTGVLFWPWARVSKRITEGGEHNVKDYYEILVRQYGSASTKVGDGTPSR